MGGVPIEKLSRQHRHFDGQLSQSRENVVVAIDKRQRDSSEFIARDL